MKTYANQIEVEFRRPLTEVAWKELRKKLMKEGTYLATKRRVFFDLSPHIGLTGRELDVRVKMTDGVTHLVVKKQASSANARDESDVIVQSDLKSVLHMLSQLGYDKGVYGDRRLSYFTYENIEYSLHEVIRISDGTTHSYSFEAEIITLTDEMHTAQAKILESMEKCEINAFDDEGWNNYEALINKEANGWFEYGKTDISKLLERVTLEIR